MFTVALPALVLARLLTEGYGVRAVFGVLHMPATARAKPDPQETVMAPELWPVDDDPMSRFWERASGHPAFFTKRPPPFPALGPVRKPLR